MTSKKSEREKDCHTKYTRYTWWPKKRRRKDRTSKGERAMWIKERKSNENKSDRSPTGNGSSITAALRAYSHYTEWYITIWKIHKNKITINFVIYCWTTIRTPSNKFSLVSLGMFPCLLLCASGLHHRPSISSHTICSYVLTCLSLAVVRIAESNNSVTRNGTHLRRPHNCCKPLPSIGSGSSIAALHKTYHLI